MWSRPLSGEEIVDYSTGCDPDFVQRSNPDMVNWSTRKLALQGKNSAKIFIPGLNFTSGGNFFRKLDQICIELSSFFEELPENGL